MRWFWFQAEKQNHQNKTNLTKQEVAQLPASQRCGKKKGLRFRAGKHSHKNNTMVHNGCENNPLAADGGQRRRHPSTPLYRRRRCSLVLVLGVFVVLALGRRLAGGDE